MTLKQGKEADGGPNRVDRFNKSGLREGTSEEPPRSSGRLISSLHTVRHPAAIDALRERALVIDQRQWLG